MSGPLQIVCEVYGIEKLSRAQRKALETALEETAADAFDKALRGLWVHEGVFGPHHPRYVICPTCDSPRGVPCRNLRVRIRFTPLRSGRYHPERYVASGNR